jgi:citrate lyase subunit beta/citryl-CoA lyase
VSYTPPYELVRSLTLFGAAAARTAAIETVFPAFRDLDGLAQYARRGMRDGFVGMMAIHPAQVGIINSAFTPTQDALDHARAVVEAFEANPDAGAVELNGKMIDAPHLKQALRLLSFAQASRARGT